MRRRGMDSCAAPTTTNTKYHSDPSTSFLNRQEKSLVDISTIKLKCRGLFNLDLLYGLPDYLMDDFSSFGEVRWYCGLL